MGDLLDAFGHLNRLPEHVRTATTASLIAGAVAAV